MLLCCTAKSSTAPVATAAPVRTNGSADTSTAGTVDEGAVEVEATGEVAQAARLSAPAASSGRRQRREKRRVMRDGPVMVMAMPALVRKACSCAGEGRLSLKRQERVMRVSFSVYCLDPDKRLEHVDSAECGGIAGVLHHVLWDREGARGGGGWTAGRRTGIGAVQIESDRACAGAVDGGGVRVPGVGCVDGAEEGTGGQGRAVVNLQVDVAHARAGKGDLEANGSGDRRALIRRPDAGQRKAEKLCGAARPLRRKSQSAP